MSLTAPPIYSRTAAQLREDLTRDLRANVPEWSATNPVTGEADQTSAALIAVAARFAEIVIERLNQAPDKNFRAFLDLLGASRLPPQPARVPLTFTVAPGSATDAVVPAGTQVAAAPAEGDKAPVIFETERELTAVAASLQALVAVDAKRDLIADHSALLSTPAPNGVSVFSGNQANEHIFYIGHADALFLTGGAALTGSAQITLTFEMSPDSPSSSTPDPRYLQWELWDGVNGIPLTARDHTEELRFAGQVDLDIQTKVPEQTVHGIRSRWLRCRLLTPISPGTTRELQMVRAAQLPLISDIRVSATVERSALVPEVAFANSQLVDVTRAFLPFGDKPRIGDVFYLGQSEALGQPGGDITLDIGLVNPTPPPANELELQWETWNGFAWELLGKTNPTGHVEGTSLQDSTKAFTESGTVTFTLPATLAPATVNGVTSNWVRVQITAGNYGVEASYQPDNDAPGGFRLVPATFAPPLVGSLTLSYYATTAPAAPDAVLAFNNGQLQDLKSALAARRAAPFIGFEAQPPTLYAAFALPPGRRTFPNRTVSLYHGVRLPSYGEKTTLLTPRLTLRTGERENSVEHTFTLTNTGPEPLEVHLSTRGGAWSSRVSPDPVSLSPGSSIPIVVSVAVPDRLPSVTVDRGFLQLSLSSGAVLDWVTFETHIEGYPSPQPESPRRELRFEYWNGRGWAKLAIADDTDRLTRSGAVEFLGPKDFAASEQFGVNGYWIRALFEPGDDQLVELHSLLPNTTFATHAITLRNEVLGSSDASAHLQFRTARSPVLAGPQLEVRESDVWVRWTEVADFHGSTSEDRHYVLDHISGQVRFGDGLQGRIPARGVGNIRMTRYQTGGGSAGNRAAGTIVQLKTTVPYVEKVSNVEPATGGFAAESDAALLTRAPRTLRHGGRAVTFDDYEDLARMASPEVARAKAVPLRRLQDDPLGTTHVPGAVSVVIVPHSVEARPLPSSALMREVEDHLRKYSPATASLAVVGPLYVRVDVSIEIALESLSGANEVETAAHEALRKFLHPLTGGRDGAGWDFGRQPHSSDLHALISELPGVDHIRRLSITQVEELPQALETQRFLVYSGQHHITLTFVGAE